MKETKFALLFGGRSPEHRVSLASAAYLLSYFEEKGLFCYPIVMGEQGALFHYHGTSAALLGGLWQAATPLSLSWDGASPPVFLEDGAAPFTPDRILSCLHGGSGENGVIQGLLTAMGLPFIGCDLLSSALTADKAAAKELVLHQGIATAPWVTVRQGEPLPSGLTPPLFVKPNDGGSSFGACLVTSEAELQEAVQNALAFSDIALIETYIRGTEIEVGVIERPNGTLLLSPPGEISVGEGFYDYDTKYETERAKLYVPARLTDEECAEVQRTAAAIFRLLRCRHFCRIDFFRTADGRFYFNEVNTLPGFTPSSMFPRLFAHAGIDAVGELLAL